MPQVRCGCPSCPDKVKSSPFRFHNLRWQQLRHGNRGTPVRERVPCFMRLFFRDGRLCNRLAGQPVGMAAVAIFVLSYQFGLAV